MKKYYITENKPKRYRKQIKVLKPFKKLKITIVMVLLREYPFDSAFLNLFKLSQKVVRAGPPYYASVIKDTPH